MKAIRRPCDPVLFVLALVATGLGLLFIFDAGYPRSIAAGKGSIPPEFRGQLVFLAAALVLGALVASVTAERWRRLAPVLWWMSFIALLLPMVPGLGVTMNHATRWFKVGPILVQPSEFAKITLVLFLAATFAGRKAWPARIKPARNFPLWLDKIAVPKFARMWPGIFVLIAVVVIEKEPDLGTAAVLAVTAFAMMWAGGVSVKSLVAAVALAVVGAGVMVVKEPYRLDRITQHATRWEARNIDDTGYQTVQSELGLAGGGMLGVGIGNGRAKHVMPAATTDFVMATVGEEMGLVGSLALLGVLGTLVWRMFWLAARAATPFAGLVLAGMGTWIAVQSCVNVMMANGTLPAIGIPLAFISSGGSSLVALWLAVGLCQSVCEPKKVKEESHAPSRYGWRDGRTRLSRT
jgi:cell division protein FtsW